MGMGLNADERGWNFFTFVRVCYSWKITMNDLAERLKTAVVFSKLAPADRTAAARVARRVTYRKGECICCQGEVWRNVLFIVAGQIEWTMLSPDGKRQVVFDLRAGDVVWAHSNFDDQPMPASLEVVEDCAAYLWTREVVTPIVSRNVEAVWDVTRVLIRWMRRVRELVYGFAFHPVAGRLARLLLDRYQPAPGQRAQRDLTLDEMAASIGTTRELVCKLLYRFADEKMIQINRTEFVFTNREKLEQLAGK